MVSGKIKHISRSTNLDLSPKADFIHRDVGRKQIRPEKVPRERQSYATIRA
jgi:hypothetical protein